MPQFSSLALSSSEPQIATKPRRLAYLCYHTAGRDVELPLWRSAGFEIFSAKIFSKEHRSSARNVKDEQVLTIPQDALDCLNKTNFIDSADWPADAVYYLNTYFDAIRIIQSHDALYNALRYFRGTIIVRLAGVDAPKNYTGYWSLAEPRIFSLLKMHESRVIFSSQYENLPDVEDPLIVRRSVYMPLAIPSYFKQRQDTWHGGEAKMIAVIPWIHVPYYNKKYHYAKNTLDGIKLRILGDQRRRFLDRRITGFLSMAKYVEHFQSARGLFYDSQEPRHVHYPPFEAVSVGLPVLFHKNSLLYRLGREPLTGACNSPEEFRVKAARLVAGDKGFIEEVRSTQKSLNDRFQDVYVARVWREAFATIDHMTAQADKVDFARLIDRQSLMQHTPEVWEEGADGKSIRMPLPFKAYMANENLVFLRFALPAKAPTPMLRVNGRDATLVSQKINPLSSTNEWIEQVWFVSSGMQTSITDLVYEIHSDSGMLLEFLVDCKISYGSLGVGNSFNLGRDKGGGNYNVIPICGFSAKNSGALELFGNTAELLFLVSDQALCSKRCRLVINLGHFEHAARAKLTLYLNGRKLGRKGYSESESMLSFPVTLQKAVNRLTVKITGKRRYLSASVAYINWIGLLEA